ncbi:MAG: SIMPL domain-containing protein [Janthinobacterium lividum]
MRRRLTSGTVVLAGLMLTGNGMAQDTARSPSDRTAPDRVRPGLITVHATAHRRLASTVADASVSIEVHGRDLRSTAMQLGRQAQALLAFLRTQNAERLRTEGTSFDPEIQELRGQPDRIKGYTGRISVSFRTAPDQLPFVLAGCLDNGATALGQFGSSPREEEVDAARRDMVAEATGAAMIQARAVAGSAGQKIAGIELAEVDPVPETLPLQAVAEFRADRAARPAAAPPPIPPIASVAGEADLSVTVVMLLRVAPPE